MASYDVFLREDFERHLTACFDHRFRDRRDPVVEAARYSLTAPGKRIRPRLAAYAYALFGGIDDRMLPIQLAIEMIHNYSLIHDDLPSMDNDDMRRGQPSCHVRYGEAVAILAGDLLLNAAYETLFEGALTDRSPRYLAASEIIAREAGGRGMIAGQSRDLSLEDDSDVTLESVRQMAERKTSALIRAALVSGAILGGADSDAQIAVYEFGTELGLAFQIRDDILDVIANKKTMGKTPGKDARDNKKTFVTVSGKTEAERLLHETSERARHILLQLTKNTCPSVTDLLLNLTNDLETRMV